MRILPTVLLAAFVAAAPALGEEPRQITVTGVGQVEGRPDLATVTAGVETQATLAGDALAENATRMQGVFAALEGQGIAAEDMQTSQLSLSPIWTDRRGDGEGPPEITGYEVSNLVTVRVRDVTAAGAVIDALATAGANRFAGISFSIAEPGPLQDQALAAAVEDARAKAERLADSAGVTLGPVAAIRESVGSSGPIALRAQAEMAMDMPLAEGSVGVEARVEVIYAIEE